MKKTSITTHPDFPGILALILLIFLLALTSLQNQQEALAARIAPSVLRFHILADSDRREDQDVKLEVRSLVLDLLKKNLPSSSGKKETIRWILSSRSLIEQTADSYLIEHGFPYQAHLSLEHTYFPTRTYDQFLFPCGYYDAVKLVLGSGNGHNWWCVLYPSFCFTDEICKPLSGKELAELKSAIKKDDYPALLDNRPDLRLVFPFFASYSPSK